MSEPIDLRRVINQVQSAQPRSSGYVIGMPGPNGTQQVPVELATVLMLDQLVSVMREMLELMKHDSEVSQQRFQQTVSHLEDAAQGYEELRNRGGGVEP